MIQIINKNLYKLKKDKKGVMAIEIVIGMFMFLMILCFMTDLITLSWKFSVVSQINSKVARQAGIQGGVLSRAPNGYPGGDNAYTDIGELNSMLQDYFSDAGIAGDEWRLLVGNRHVLGSGASSPTRQFEYRDSFKTQIDVTYTWSMLSNFIPGNLTNTLSSTRPTLSEWQYNYDRWIGE